ncbi:hypothetical protein [Aeromonas veronii]|uniref:hypothetical protein n=1 Tax=Aeromonas veronii TaxID=654 RepID=UPI0011169C3B|nr:hypothetical protein [Aeromonas veronii]
MNITKIQNTLPILTIYFLTISTLYSLGYWNSFNINILDFMSISDVAKASIPMLIKTSFLVTCSIIFSEFVLVRHLSLNYDEMNSDSLSAIPRRIFIAKFILFSLLGTLVISSIFLDRVFMWSVLGTSAMIYLFMTIRDADFLSEISEDRIVRKMISFVLIYLLCNSYYDGVRNAKNVRASGENIKIDGKDTTKSLIGLTVDYIFLLDRNTGSVDIVRRETINSIQIPPAENGPLVSIKLSNLLPK